MHAMPSIMYYSSECLHESVLVKFMHSEYHYSAHNALLLAVQLPHIVYSKAINLMLNSSASLYTNVTSIILELKYNTNTSILYLIIYCKYLVSNQLFSIVTSSIPSCSVITPVADAGFM